MNHTSGPWEACWDERNKRTHTGEWYWVAPDTQFLGQLINVRTKSRTGAAEANARLIAAAPELLEACRAALALIDANFHYADGKASPCYDMPARIALAAAIAKAEGR